jgi:hypothetical protein
MVAPQMGNQLVDPGAPEFHGAPFTRTFIYGAYDGRITFFEPMITTASLMATPHECTPVKLPRSYDETAYHPTKYCTVLDNDNQSIRVFLGGFVYRQAPSGSH